MTSEREIPNSQNYNLSPVFQSSVLLPKKSVPIETGNGCDSVAPDLQSRALMNGSESSSKLNMSVLGNETSSDYYWGVLLLLPIVVFGVAGNILVCMAVSMEKRLQSVTNYFLLSLAITDLLVCLIVWPFSMLNEFMGKCIMDFNYVHVSHLVLFLSFIHVDALWLHL